MNYQQALEFLETLPDMERARHGSGISMSLTSMKNLLALLGNPQNKTKTIHVAGSKGKGSTVAFIASILQAAGLHTAVYTSPHLHSYRERIAFDLSPVDEDEFAGGIAVIAETIRENNPAAIGPLSTFGVLTALFFYLVANSNRLIDWQIVEVGLGGTEDATNVFAEKEIAVITPISLEHTAILGNSIESIAAHKAGIITNNASVILAPQDDPMVKKVVMDRCNSMGAHLIDVSERFTRQRHSFDSEEQSFLVIDGINSIELGIRLGGRHQIANACTALVTVDAVENMGHVIGQPAKRNGLKNAHIPGRFEVFRDIGANRQGHAITTVLDGAHNQNSARALAQALQDYFPGQRCVVILALNSDKNVETFWAEISQCSHQVVLTKTDNPRALEPEVLQKRIENCDLHAEVSCAQNVAAALELASKQLQGNGVICVTGSLYLVAEARELLAGRHTVICQSSQLK